MLQQGHNWPATHALAVVNTIADLLTWASGLEDLCRAVKRADTKTLTGNTCTTVLETDLQRICHLRMLCLLILGFRLGAISNIMPPHAHTCVSGQGICVGKANVLQCSVLQRER